MIIYFFISFFLLSPSFCFNCTSIRGCLNCTTPPLCQICAQNYYLHTNKSCQPCLDGCQKCTSPLTCTECRLGYYYQGGKCESCQTYCGFCNNQYSCNTCLNGYYLNNISVCTACVGLFQACLLCNSTHCLNCFDGYNAEDGKCEVSGHISKVEIIIIATVSSVVVLLVVLACGLAYYLKRSRRTLVHDTITRSQMALELDPSTEQHTEANIN